MPKTLFRFVKQAASLAQKHMQPAQGGGESGGWPRIRRLEAPHAPFFLRVHMGASYAEIVD